MYVHPCAKCQYIPLRRPLIASVGLSMSAARPTLVAFFISSISSIRLLYLQCQSTRRWPWDCALTFLAVFYLFRFSSTWRTCLTTLSTLDLFGDATGEEVISAEYAARVLKGGGSFVQIPGSCVERIPWHIALPVLVSVGCKRKHTQGREDAAYICLLSLLCTFIIYLQLCRCRIGLLHCRVNGLWL